MMNGAMIVPRGCGTTRSRSGAYFELGLSSRGIPFDDFLIDPPIEVPNNLGLKAIGVTLFQRNGVWHLIDWIGEEHYPNVADWVEESKRFGISRRLPSNLPFELLTPESRLMVVHRKAFVRNGQDFPDWNCPQNKEKHQKMNLMVYRSIGESNDKTCLGLCWETIEGGKTIDPENDRTVIREMPAFSYHARKSPFGVIPEYGKPSFFGAFPCSRLVVVRGEKSKKTLMKLRKSSLPAMEVKE